MRKCIDFFGFSSLALLLFVMVAYRFLMNYYPVYIGDLFSSLQTESLMFNVGSKTITFGIKLCNEYTEYLTAWATDLSFYNVVAALLAPLGVLAGFVTLIFGLVAQAFSVFDFIWAIFGQRNVLDSYVYHSFISHFTGGFWHLG